MLLENIVDLTKRIHKRDDDKLRKQGQSDKIPSAQVRKIRKTALGLRNRVKQKEDQTAAVKQQQKDLK